MAAALVADAIQRGRDMRLANGLTSGVKASAAVGQGVTALGVVQLTANRAFAVSDYSATLCSSGTSTIDIADAIITRFQADPNATMLVGDVITLSSTQCVVKAAVDLGNISLGDFGVGSKIDGRFALKLTERDATDFVFTLTYAGFSYTPFGGAAFPALDALLTFGSRKDAAGKSQAVYTLDIPNTRFLSAPVAASAGNVVTINSGSMRSLAPTALGAGYLDYGFSSWAYDSVTAKAGGGTVTITGAGGTSAVVTATDTGYAVKITLGTRIDTYQVAN